MLKIKKISINGVKSYFINSKISFQTGTTVILGPNGAGKSTLLECIKYGLFGELMDKNQTLSDFLNDTNKLEIKLTFEYDKNIYIVKREAKISGKVKQRTITKDEITFPNGETIEEKTAVNKKIRDDILGVSAKIMDTASFIKQGSLQDIISLKGAKLRKEFSEILQLNRFEELKSVWNTMAKRIRSDDIVRFIEEQEILEEKIKEIPNIKLEITQCQKQQKIIKTEIENLEKQKLKIQERKLKRDLFHKDQIDLEKDIAILNKNLDQNMIKLASKDKKLRLTSLNQISNKTIDELGTEKNETLHKEGQLRDFYQLLIQKKGPLKQLYNTKNPLDDKLNTLVSKISKLLFDYKDLKLNFPNNLKLLNQQLNDLKTDTQKQLSHHENLGEKLDELISCENIIKEKLAKIETLDSNLKPYFRCAIEELEQINLENEKNVVEIISKIQKHHSRLEKQFEIRKSEYETIQLEYDELNREILHKENVLDELQTLGVHECKTCYSIISKERLEETVSRVNKFLSEKKPVLSNIKIQLEKVKSKYEIIDQQFNKYNRYHELETEKSILFFAREKNDCIKIMQQANKDKKEIIQKYSIQNMTHSTLRQQIGSANKKVQQLIEIETKIANYTSDLDQLNKVQEEINSFELQIKNLYSTAKIDDNLTVKEIKNQIDLLEVRQKKYEDEINLIHEILFVKEDINRLETELNDKNQKLSEIYQTLKLPNYVNVENEWDIIITNITESSKEYENLLQSNATNKEKLLQLKNDEKQLEKIKEKISKLEEVEMISKEMQKIFAMVHPEILQQKTKNIEYKTNEMLNQFPSESGILNLEIDDKFNLWVRRSNNSRKMSINTLSGGEKMSAAFSLRVAMSKELMDIGFMVLDEPTDGLDEERRKLLAEIIANQQHVKQLFVVTHDNAFNGKTNDTIMVKQTNGSSLLSKSIDEPEDKFQTIDDQLENY